MSLHFNKAQNPQPAIPRASQPQTRNEGKRRSRGRCLPAGVLAGALRSANCSVGESQGGDDFSGWSFANYASFLWCTSPLCRRRSRCWCRSAEGNVTISDAEVADGGWRSRSRPGAESRFGLLRPPHRILEQILPFCLQNVSPDVIPRLAVVVSSHPGGASVPWTTAVPSYTAAVPLPLLPPENASPQAGRSSHLQNS